MSEWKLNLTKAEQEERTLQAIKNTNEMVEQSKKRALSEAKDVTLNVMKHLEEIELKNRCMRVRFLDWLSAKLLSWSKSVHEMSNRIDSPCVIKLPENKDTTKPLINTRLNVKIKK